MSKYIFVTGGVVSSLGKGITGASIGKLLQYSGLKVTMIKCDPYINVDAGTMNPYQHGEVFVTEDGAETDLDLGSYERFLETRMSHDNIITAGNVYKSVIERERKGEYLGATVQVIPHVTDEIKRRFKAFEKKADVVIIEIGGTVGDIESLPFLEAARQMKLEYGPQDVMYIHVTLVPYIPAADELKTKPTQHSVHKLREIGIDPNMIICRTDRPLEKSIKQKIALFCSVPATAVLEAADAKSIYDVPQALQRQGVNEQVHMLLGIRATSHNFEEWTDFMKRSSSARETVRIAIAGKYTSLKDAYKSVSEALLHAAMSANLKLAVDYVDVEDPELLSRLAEADGIILPGGFGNRGIEGKIRTAQYARESGKPFLGICLGMQCAVIEAARNLAGIKNAHSSEFMPRCKYPVIDLIADQKKVTGKGGTMRLGGYETAFTKGSALARIYGKPAVTERHRHRYEVNPEFVPALEKAGLKVTGYYKPRRLAETVEYKNHPWYIGVQYHPEFNSTPLNPSPLFKAFLAAGAKGKQPK
ncbi:MAG: CTP synthase [Elusimicrobiaceae bacterium]|nr:CTP synthase [Elusimicrobiaceae bacterium]